MSDDGRVILTSFPSVCVDCGKLILRGSHALWDGGAHCLVCVQKKRGVASDGHDLAMSQEELDRLDAPVQSKRRGR